MNKSRQITIKSTHLGAIIALAVLVASSQSSFARTAVGGPFIDLQTTLPVDTITGGTAATSFITHIVYNSNATPVLPYQPCSGTIAPPQFCGNFYGADTIGWVSGGTIDNPFRVIGTLFPVYDDTDASADIHFKTIYGMDLNPDGSVLSMGGISTSQPQISFQDETLVAPDGTTYSGGAATVVAIRDLPGVLGEGFDLSFLQGNPDDVVYLFDTAVPAAGFQALGVLNPFLAPLGTSSVKDGFAVDLPLTHTPATGVEPRSGGKRGSYTVDFYFNNSLASVETAATSCGSVVSTQIDSNDPHLFVVSLSAPTCNGQDVTVTLTGIVDDQGNVLDSAPATVGLLIGDTDGDRTVTRGTSVWLKPFLVKSRMGRTSAKTSTPTARSITTTASS
jgi:hypothetical protein